MKTAAYLAATLVTFLAASACNGPSARNVSVASPIPTAPSPPASQQGEITVRSIVPASGATLTVRPCESDAGFLAMCADRVPLMTFDVQYRANLPNVWISVSFYQGVQLCGNAASNIVALTAGAEAVAFTVSTIVLSHETGALLCPLPATTTRLVVQVFNRNGVPGSTATLLLKKEFDHTYTFAQP